MSYPYGIRSGMSKFRKKPVVIDAVQWTGSIEKITEWLQSVAPLLDGCSVELDLKTPPNIVLHIVTLEGDMRASRGDWIIKGVKGELYPCKPDIFQATYDPEPILDEQEYPGR